MPPKRKWLVSGLVGLAPWVFIIIVAVVAYRVIDLISQKTFQVANDAGMEYISSSGLKACMSQFPADSPVKASQIAACLQEAKTTAQVFGETVNPRIEELKWLLTIIATIGGFFAVAQGAAAWFSAQLYTKQAEDGLKAISDAQEAIKARYPLFDHVEAVRNEAIEALNSVFTAASKAPDSWAGNTEALDWGDNLFRRLGVEARQKLLSVESFASIDLDRASSSGEHSDILRKFSLFYRSKFLFEEGVAGGILGDLERAEAYLILASKKKADFTIKNDLGSLYGTIYSVMQKKNPNAKHEAADYLDKAQNAFRESLIMEPNQQRAHYSLAVIQGAHLKRYSDAVMELELGLRQKVWQRENSDYMQTIMFYNMACYQSQILQKNWDRKSAVTLEKAQTVTEFLEKAASVSYVRKDILERDFNNKDEGDFTGLINIAAPKLVQKLRELRSTLEKNAHLAGSGGKKQAPPSPPSMLGAFAEAARLVKNALLQRS